MWHGCLQAVRSTQTDRRVRKHARRTWSVSAATRSRLKVQTGDQDDVGWHHNFFQKVWCWCGVGVVWVKVVSCVPP